MTQPATAGALLRQRLEETDRSAAELAEAAQVPTRYVEELMDGTRRPPLPNRTDVWDKMTRFLKLGRNQLANLALAERDATDAPPRLPSAAVTRALWTCCAAKTRKTLEGRGGKGRNDQLADIVQRVLTVTQTDARRRLNDSVALTTAARRKGQTYAVIRLRLLEFLDTSTDTLTVRDVEEFIMPRVSLWELDADSGALRIVMRASQA